MADDPTRQARQRNALTKKIKARLDDARKKIEGFNITTANTSLRDRILKYIDDELDTDSTAPPLSWFYKNEIEMATRQGTIREVTNINRELEAAIIAGIIAFDIAPEKIKVDDFLKSKSYLRELNKAYTSNYKIVKSFSRETAKDVFDTINKGLKQDKSKQDLVNDIAERFDVSKSKAQRIVDTEVNRAYNDARIRAAKVAERQFGVPIYVKHISALLETTRPHHAARHEKIYTMDDQLAWWDEGANRINCYCTIEALIRVK